jgi:hypothetical protein
MRRLLASCALLSLATLARAEAIAPDRPGFSTGTATVAPGQFNLELGLTGASSAEGPAARSLSFPETNLRVGLTPRLELGLQWAGMSTSWPGRAQASGDLTLGAKCRLAATPSAHLSALGSLTVQTAGGGPAVSPLLALLWDAGLTERTTLYGMVQGRGDAGDSGRGHLAAALGLTQGLGGAFGVFAELYADRPVRGGGGGGGATVADGGVTWLVREWAQLDLSAGVPLGGGGEVFVGVGLAVQLP